MTQQHSVQASSKKPIDVTASSTQLWIICSTMTCIMLACVIEYAFFFKQSQNNSNTINILLYINVGLLVISVLTSFKVKRVAADRIDLATPIVVQSNLSKAKKPQHKRVTR